MDLYIVNINDIKNTDELYNQLNQEQQIKASKFIHEDDKKRSIIASYLINKYSGEGILKYKEYGKPFKNNGIHFNASHSYDYVIIGVSKHNVGVDIEKVREFDEKLANYVFDFKIDNAYDLYMYWTRKEAYIKYFGKSVSKDIKQVPVNDDKLYFRSVDYFNYVISVVIQTEEEINIKRIFNL